MKRSPENIKSFMSLFTKLCEKEKLLSHDLSALEKLVEYGSRYTEDRDKISTQFGKMADVLRDAKTPGNICHMVNKSLECYAEKMKAFYGVDED